MKIKISFFILLLITTICLSQKIENHSSFDVTIQGKGETLFLIPGLSCAANVWNETINEFKNDYEIHTFTLAGFAGVKPITKDSILPVIKKDLAMYINKHKTQNSILIGHSIGGFLSLQLGTENSDIVSKIIIVDALPFLAGAFNPNITEDIVKTSYVSMKDSYTQLSDEGLIQNFKTTLNSMIRNKSKIDFVLKESIKSDKKTLGITMFEMMSNDIRDDISNIKIPILILTNWNLPIPQMPNITKSSKLSVYQEQYKNCVPCNVRIIEEAEHFIMLDNPTVFYDVVKSFISE